MYGEHVGRLIKCCGGEHDGRLFLDAMLPKGHIWSRGFPSLRLTDTGQEEWLKASECGAKSNGRATVQEQECAAVSLRAACVTYNDGPSWVSCEYIFQLAVLLEEDEVDW